MSFLRMVFPALILWVNGANMAYSSSGSPLVLNKGLNTLVMMPGEGSEINIDSAFFVDNMPSWLQKKTDRVFTVTAPKAPGFYSMPVAHSSLSGTRLQIIVQTPIDTSKVDELNGYQINRYPPAYKALPQYSPPKGLIEVSRDDEQRFLVEGIQVKDLLCKQASSYPKYFLVTTDGLSMLSRLKHYLLMKGLNFERFSFISAYRTPYYNKLIGNGRHSRHLYGDAYDIYIDNDGDQRMDDINGDGITDRQDVDFLYSQIVNFLQDDKRLGGVGKYYANSRHGGFVHIDNRGFTARW